jgi:hypothetical protein
MPRADKVMASFALGWEERCILRAVDLAFAPLSLVFYRKRGPCMSGGTTQSAHGVQDNALVSRDMVCNPIHVQSTSWRRDPLTFTIYQMKRLEQSTMYFTF